MQDNHPGAVGLAGVGGLAAVGHFMHMIEPILADISYVAAIAVAIATLWSRFRHK